MAWHEWLARSRHARKSVAGAGFYSGVARGFVCAVRLKGVAQG